MRLIKNCGGDRNSVKLSPMKKAALVDKIPTISVGSEGDGAVVTFEGRPRNDNGIEALHYEAHEPMAQRELEGIREEALKKFPVSEVFIYHRLGRVPVGEVSFKVVVCAPHRREAFDCCAWIVDEVKKRVPIWKREIYPGGREGDWIYGS